MSVIGQRTFSTGVDQFFNLSNEEFVRPMRMGSNWNAVKIGIMGGIDAQFGGNITAAFGAFGVCSSGASFGTASSNFIGSSMVTNTLDGATMTYVANSGSPYYVNNTSAYAIKKIGTTLTPSASSFATLGWWPVTPWLARRGIWYLYITKGSPTWTVQTNHYAGIVDWTFPQFLDGLEQTGTTNIQGTAFGGLSQSLTFNESLGAMDTVNFFWNRMYPFEVYAIGVARVS